MQPLVVAQAAEERAVDGEGRVCGVVEAAAEALGIGEGGGVEAGGEEGVAGRGVPQGVGLGVGEGG